MSSSSNHNNHPSNSNKMLGSSNSELVSNVLASGGTRFNRDLTPSEQSLLLSIRRRKATLLQEIAQLQQEIEAVTKSLNHNQQPHGNKHFQDNNHLFCRLAEPERTDDYCDGGNNVNSSGDAAEGYYDSVPMEMQDENTNPSSSSSAAAAALTAEKKNRSKLLSLGCKKFNMDPKKGIEFLAQNRLLGDDTDEGDGPIEKPSVEAVAQFLYRGEGLNKTAIGDYLGEKNDFNESVLKSFVELHDFTDLILVQALRQFLWSFRLPGEAQKIDRMMECFAQRYCQLNTDIFTNTDTCYVLSFAIIMLNTSLHNPSVKEKPSVDQFIAMNRGINNGGDLPRELLISLYNSIQAEPFKIPEDDGNDLMHTFFNPDKEGWLWKQGGRYRTWKRRWFILNDNCLYYFEFTTDKEPRGIIPLENVGVRVVNGDNKSRPFCFEIFSKNAGEVIKACKTDSDGRVVEGKHSVYRMCAGGEEERDQWVGSLKGSVKCSPFFEKLLGNSGVASGGGNSAGGGGGFVRNK